jgi:hypothetical protein
LRRLTLPGLLLGLTLSFPVFSGGGPETTLVVVNAASPLSLEIANEYVNLRQIPPTHVLFLQNVPYLRHIDLKQFRQRIWQPIQNYLTRRGLMDQIDTISYSSGFPYDVDFKRQSKKLKLPKHRILGRRASLTGLTYYARQIATGEPGYLSENRYFRRNLSPGRCRGPVGMLRKEDKQRLKEANHNLKSKKFQKASAAYQVLLKNNPHNNRIPFDLARSYAALGRGEKALEALEKAVDACWSNSQATVSDRYLKSLRDHPVFQLLLQRMRTAYGPFEPTRGFSSRYRWSRSPGGNRSDRYFLSTFLAYTGPRGNSVGEILGYLRAAAASDGSQPNGTVYLMENKNVRSVTRQPLFPATVKELEARKHRVEILSRGQKGQNGILPRNREDVIGLVAGSSNFDWKASGSQLLPGAIAETLTSYGAHFRLKKQTKLSEFLRYGAAGSSGAVAEPYALQDKFPVPMIHAYYADGVSLAEAFYQSLRHPYQTLVVGDPLARPFARFAEVSLERPDPAEPWQGRIQLLPRIQPATEHPVIRVELWIDGQQLASTTLDRPILWDTTGFDDGAHELRLVAVEVGPIQTRSDTRLTIMLNNRNQQVVLQAPTREVAYGDPLPLSGTAPGAQQVELIQGYRSLATIPVTDGRWQTTLPSTQLGIGAVRVTARALYADETAARSLPAEIRITEPERLTASAGAYPTLPGLKVELIDRDGGAEQRVIKGLDKRSLAPLTSSRERLQRVDFEGEFEIETPGFYELVFGSRGRVVVAVDDMPVIDEQLTEEHPEVFAGVSLETGWHQIEISIEPDRKLRLYTLIAGAAPAFELTGERVRHRR